MSSELKLAFERSRAESNIDLILPVLLRARLAVIVKTLAPGERPAFYLTSSPAGPGVFCVTCAEETANLARVPDLEVEWMDGRTLLERINPAWEAVIVYADGGDYLSRAHLEWFRKILVN